MANDFDESSANEEASKGLSWWYSADVLSRDKSDKTAKRIRRISITDRLLRHPGRLSMVYFGALIIIVTGLLLLPDLFRVNHGNMGRTLWQALFYAVSAYNNTGFTPDATGLHVNRWGVGLPILISAFIGTLGFPVVLNLVQCARRRLSPKRWTLHTKLTLVTTAVLVATSLAWFLLVEWSNTGLFPADDPGMKMRRAMSAAVMPRSAGFDISWVPEVTNETKVFMSILMFIGAGSSSTAGGIRVTTFAVILLICRAAFTGHRDVTVFRRRIPRRIQMTAVSVTTACFALVMVGAMMLMFTTGCAFVDAVFEACSAFSLGGYSVGVASAGNPARTAPTPRPLRNPLPRVAAKLSRHCRVAQESRGTVENRPARP